MSKAPAKNPCGSCPYRCDVPSGVWHPEEYAKLPAYDAETQQQPAGVFFCHQADGRVCAGWAGTHDMDHNLAVRLAPLNGTLSPEDVEAVVEYTTSVPLFGSGAEAAAHGMKLVRDPDDHARRVISRLEAKLTQS